MVEEMSPAEAARLLQSQPDQMVLLDVREPFERRMAVIQPSLHIPMNDVRDRKEEIPRNRRIVVYCHTGSRSALVAGYLESEGFENVANLSGGIEAWSRDVDVSIPRY